MIPGTMTRNNKTGSKKLLKISFFLIFSFICFNAHSEEKWVLGAQKFSFKGSASKNAVSSAMSEMYPAIILENLGKTLKRDVYPNEILERRLVELQKERLSLYLQLSSEYKKRDSLVLYDYSKAKLRMKQKESEREIKKLYKKIEANIKNEKLEYEKAERNTERLNNGDYITDRSSEWEKLTALVKSFFSDDGKIITKEDIVFYKDDVSALFSVSDEIMDEGYDSYNFKQEIKKEGINSLLTGEITNYGKYVSVSVDLYLYPSAKKIASVVEIGSVDEPEFLCSSIARKLSPYIANALPVKISISFEPAEILNKADMFIDDVQQDEITKNLVLQSGIHTIQFVCEGYKTEGTTYYFEGNMAYNIEVEMEKETNTFLNIAVDTNVKGQIIANGSLASEVKGKVSHIKINGKTVLGEFFADEKNVDFFYIPENLISEDNLVTVKQNPMDSSSYIDTRRKWMYTSYTLFVLSLIPTMISYGSFSNELSRYNNGFGSEVDVRNSQTVSQICSGVTIAFAVFWVYELVRYLVAANKVLPVEAKLPDKKFNLEEAQKEIEPVVPAEENPEDITIEE